LTSSPKFKVHKNLRFVTLNFFKYLVLLKHSSDQLQASLPQLQAIYNSRSSKPLVSFFEGFEGIKTVLEKTLQSKQILVVCSGGQKPMNQQLLDYMFKTYLPKTNQKKHQNQRNHHQNRRLQSLHQRICLQKPSNQSH